MIKWIILVLVVLLALFASGLIYLNRWAKFFVNAAVERENDWFMKDGARLLNPGWEDVTDSKQQERADFWLQENTWQIETPDRLRLTGAAFLQEGQRWVIAVHGYRSTGFQDMADVAMHYYHEGYNVLVPDLRGHGRSEGKIIGMGWLDRLDLVQWIQVICEQDPAAKIILHGCSLGAAAVLMASGEKLPDNVKLIISDSAYTSVYSEFKWLLHKYTKYPVNRFMVLANRYARRKMGYSLIRASVTRQLGSNHLPVLFLHDRQDPLVPVTETTTLMEATAGEKSCVIFETTGHMQAKTQQPADYWETVATFISTHFPKAAKSKSN
mgnify:CR=1 FL=1